MEFPYPELGYGIFNEGWNTANHQVRTETTENVVEGEADLGGHNLGRRLVYQEEWSLVRETTVRVWKGWTR